jgi:Tfp pilus assembly protein PilV
MKSQNSHRDRIALRRERHGFVLLAVMICLIAVSVLVVGWFKSAAFERQQVRAAERRLQADWLAEAAVNRAAALLDKNANYAGETWNLSAVELAASDAAAIEIRVAPVTDRPERRSIHVAADFPADSLRKVRVTKEIVVDIATKNRNSGAAKANPAKPDAEKRGADK